jgi:hypothetical protein
MTTLLQTGSIWIAEGFLPDSRDLFAVLAASIPWDERIRARKAASFGLPYNYSGIKWPAAPFPAVLVPVLERVAGRLGYRPNNCLAHYYPDGTSTMGFHTDATDDLVPGTGIAVVSVGSERTITFRNQHDRQLLEHYRLKSGSLLYMSPGIQPEWKHGILAADNVVGGRISLTFRCMKSGTAAQV